MEQPDFKPVEHALVDDRTQHAEYLKSHHAVKQEAPPSRRWGSSHQRKKVDRSGMNL